MSLADDSWAEGAAAAHFDAIERWFIEEGSGSVGGFFVGGMDLASAACTVSTLLQSEFELAETPYVQSIEGNWPRDDLHTLLGSSLDSDLYRMIVCKDGLEWHCWFQGDDDHPGRAQAHFQPQGRHEFIRGDREADWARVMSFLGSIGALARSSDAQYVVVASPGYFGLSEPSVDLFATLWASANFRDRWGNRP